jgi:uncharacterized membrane protein YedE/YeeE
MILQLLRAPWPWYVSGPLIGLFVPLLLVVGNKQLGMSGALRAMCAAIAPGKVEFFRYDWRANGAWNLALAAGIVVGAMLATRFLGGGAAPMLSPGARATLATLGMSAPSSLVPAELFRWSALLTVRGALCVLVGGFLAGFGTSYAGGCTSGHGIMGLASLQVASLIALMGIFAGGLLATFLIIPRLF